VGTVAGLRVEGGSWFRESGFWGVEAAEKGATAIGVEFEVWKGVGRATAVGEGNTLCEDATMGEDVTGAGYSLAGVVLRGVVVAGVVTGLNGAAATPTAVGGR
jgi:hypothetical protein